MSQRFNNAVEDGFFLVVSLGLLAAAFGSLMVLGYLDMPPGWKRKAISYSVGLTAGGSMYHNLRWLHWFFFRDK